MSSIPLLVSKEISGTQVSPTSFVRFSGFITFTALLVWITRETVDNPACQLILDPRPEGWFRYPEAKAKAEDDDRPSSMFGDNKPGLYEGSWRHFLPEFIVMPLVEAGYARDRTAQYCLILDAMRYGPIPTARFTGGGDGTRRFLS